MSPPGGVPLPDLPTYTGWVADFLELLPPRVFVERLTADGYRDVLLAPDWSRNKLAVLAAIERELARRNSRQGASATNRQNDDWRSPGLDGTSPAGLSVER